MAKKGSPRLPIHNFVGSNEPFIHQNCKHFTKHVANLAQKRLFRETELSTSALRAVLLPTEVPYLKTF